MADELDGVDTDGEMTWAQAALEYIEILVVRSDCLACHLIQQADSTVRCLESAIASNQDTNVIEAWAVSARSRVALAASAEHSCDLPTKAHVEP